MFYPGDPTYFKLNKKSIFKIFLWKNILKSNRNMYTRMFKFGMLRTYFFHDSIFQIKKRKGCETYNKIRKI